MRSTRLRPAAACAPGGRLAGIRGLLRVGLLVLAAVAAATVAGQETTPAATESVAVTGPAGGSAAPPLQPSPAGPEPMAAPTPAPDEDLPDPAAAPAAAAGEADPDVASLSAIEAVSGETAGNNTGPPLFEVLCPDLAVESMAEIAPCPAPDPGAGGDTDVSAVPSPPAGAAATPATQAIAAPAVPNPDPVAAEPFELFGKTVAPGTRAQLGWSAGQSFAGRALNTPVLVVHGHRRGPVLCLTAAIHGDELNGVEIVRRVTSAVDPDALNGTIMGVPIVNLLGLTRGSRYLPDRRDLNRYFPGNPRGSAASRIAYLFFEQLVKKCDYLVDFHTGSFMRANLPQLRADLRNDDVLAFTKYFGATAVLHHRGGRGTLRRAASDAGIPAITFELGEPNTLQLEHVEFGVDAIDTLLDKLGMSTRFRLWSEPQPVYYASVWVRAERGGILISSTRLGARIAEGELIGAIVNPLTNDRVDIVSPMQGRVLGMALNQFVLPGFAAYHIGIATEGQAAVRDSAEDIGADTEQDPEAMDADTEDDTDFGAEPSLDPDPDQD
ncbi:MAG: succinylglutamate desuccinylase/aspartoacylase family protein [Gammaproteobacteria bacterium]|nr:succinylglutamate desuccinylase/aspartoacylase family protein [Gammaproteobacteria bacterium]